MNSHGLEPPRLLGSAQLRPREPLSARLRRDTRAAHRSAESVVFLRGLFKGCLRPSSYLLMLRRLHPVYQALEDALTQHRDDPRVGLFYLPQLFRSAALAADLEAAPALLGLPPPASAAQLDVAPGAAYAARLAALASADPLLLIAHAYTRYLGDLSGGQLVRRVISRVLGLRDAGLAGFDFPVDPESAKRDFRARLDRLPVSPTEAAALSAEAQRAFRLSAALFSGL